MPPGEVGLNHRDASIDGNRDHDGDERSRPGNLTLNLFRPSTHD
jgi:hypothetical protein